MALRVDRLKQPRSLLGLLPTGSPRWKPCHTTPRRAPAGGHSPPSSKHKHDGVSMPARGFSQPPSGKRRKSGVGLGLIWIQIRLRPPAARDECVPLPGLYSRPLLAGVAPIKSRKLLPGIKWQEQGSQGQAPGFIKKSFTPAFQLSQNEPENICLYMEIFGGKKRTKGSRLQGGSAVQMCCSQGLSPTGFKPCNAARKTFPKVL